MTKFDRKININFLHFSYENFTLENFQNEIMKNFQLNSTYSILLKISSGNNLIFKMCGPQIGLVLKNEHNLEYYSKLYNLILTRIETTINNYNYLDSIDALEIRYSLITLQEELLLKNLADYNLNKQVINVSLTKKNFNQNLLPLTVNENYFGFPASSNQRSNFIKLILLKLAFFFILFIIYF